MAISHTNRIRYNYSAGSSSQAKDVSVTETAGGSIAISEAFTIGATPTDTLVVTDFNVPTPADVKSVYIVAEQTGSAGGGTLATGSFANQGGASAIGPDPVNAGEPIVWSDNGGNNFPQDASNPFLAAATSLEYTPDAGLAQNDEVTIIAYVLYDPT
jgi:hypothetical protein